MASPTYDFSGIVSTADQSNAIYLPLDKLDVHISIVDVSARVVLSQEYSHHGSDTLSEVFYVFPVPARAAVCNFQMIASNGTRLKGVVKELSQAKDDYQNALSEGLLTGLLEQFHQDVFVVSIGSMPPNTNVTVLLSYVVDLSEDDEVDSIRFQLSSQVRARYGAPSSSALYHEKAHSAPLTITVDLTMPGEILEATSLNHTPFLDMPVPSTTLSSPGTRRSRHFARKRFSSDHYDLRLDFLLTVHAYGLGRPRCFAERLSREENNSRSVVGPTTALAFTIVPQFNLRIRTAQEYIFVIDRSGSMTGNGIHIAKQALKLLLKQLPSNSMFNIYSFGSTFYPMWPESRPHVDATVHEATRTVDFMEADMGGTELLDALRGVFDSRRLDIPTSVFVLTDGFIYDINSAVVAVRGAVLNAPVPAPLRVFTIGMGSGASEELCTGIALAGNGSSMMTVEGEPLVFKALRLVKAMETPQVNTMSIDWGHDVVGQVRQAPHRIGALSPGMRLLVTAIIPGDRVPTEVTLMLHLADGTTVEYKVPVELVSDHVPESLMKTLGGTADIPPLIHTLAAHLLIQDVEGSNTQPLELQQLTAPSPETSRNVIKRYIVELGTQYQVASSRTAFIAIAAPAASSKPPGHRGNGNRRDSQSKDGRQRSSQATSSTTTSSNHNQSSRNKRSGTHHDQSNTNGEPDANKSVTSGVKAHSTSSKQSSKDPPARGDTSKQAEPDVKSDDEVFTTPHTTPTQKGGLASQKTSPRSKPSQSHVSQGKKGPVSGSSSNPEKTQSQSSTGRMPGAFRQSPDTGSTAFPGRSLFDYFTYKPSPDSIPVIEVICVPDPQGGSPTIFTAPPPPNHTTITTLARSWLKSLRSFIVPKNLSRSQRDSSMGALRFPVIHKASFPEAILTITGLQSSDGSFPCVSKELSLVVGIPELKLRGSAPTAYGENNEAIWATAIAIAFCEKRHFSHVALWEDKVEKAKSFGSRVCGSADKFEAIIQEALMLFLP